MAKRAEEPLGKVALDRAESKMEEFAEDLGRLLGTARAKAEGWIGQRQQIAKSLEGIRDTASSLLSQLGHEAQAMLGRRGRPAGTATRGAGAGSAAPKRRRRRKMSAEARERIRQAQLKRWAK